MRDFFANPFSLIFFFIIINASYSQERTVTGFVTALENIAVVDAEVKVLSSKVTVLTDADGGFKVNCSLNDKIKISAKGFYSEKVKIDEKTKETVVNLKLKPREKNLDLAVGYGHIKEEDRTYGISTIKNDDEFKFAKYSSMSELITNMEPSITVGGGQIIIRGSSSLFGSSAALIVINGRESSYSELNQLLPVAVKSVDVLKGSAAAIYGSRGGNGVVLVTTKGTRRD